MKKATLLLVMMTAFLLNNSYAQVTTKGGTSKTETEPAKSDKSDKKDKVQDEMSKDAATTAKEWTTKMKEICNLDPTQEKKVMEINLKYANKLEELKTKYKGMENPNADAAKAEKDELTKQRFKEYSNVLSKEQMQKFKDYRQSKKGEDEGDKAGKKDDAKEKYKNATPEEKEKMKEEMKEKKDKKSNN